MILAEAYARTRNPDGDDPALSREEVVQFAESLGEFLVSALELQPRAPRRSQTATASVPFLPASLQLRHLPIRPGVLHRSFGRRGAESVHKSWFGLTLPR
jgi:hypothetical protein